MITKTKLILLSILIYGNATAQSPSWQWAKSAGGNSSDNGTSITADDLGNTYIAGGFDSPVLNFGTTTLTSVGGTDIFIAKHDASGNVLWAKSAGGTTGYDYANSVAVDAFGNTYITGIFQSTTLSFGTTTLTNVGSIDIFLAKYDASGNLLWAKNAGGTSSDDARSVAADASGNIYMTGSFQSPTLSFGTTTLTNVSSGSNDIFLAKYDPFGNVLWAKSAGGTSSDVAHSVAVDASGNTYMTGFFISPTLSFSSTTLTNAGWTDIFLAKYDASGNVLWAKSAGGTGTDEAYSITIDASGNNYITGYFRSPTISFASTSLTNTDNTGNTTDIFLTKYNASGNVLWAKSAGGTSSDEAHSATIDAVENIYITGFFWSPTLSLGSTTLTNAGGRDIFLLKYDGLGNLLWTKGSGGTGSDEAHSLAIDTSGNAYLAGSFSSPSLSFGSTTLTNANNTGNTPDIFLAKLNNLTGVDELSNASNISVFPNPSKGILIIKSERKISIIEIENILGEKIYSSVINSNKSEIDLSNQVNGIYFINIKADQGTATKKIIIVK